jgi:arabinose 5-phosphate isomerase
MSNAAALLAFARETLEIELTEAQRLLARLDDNFVCACELLLNCRGKAVISGIGKSGHIGKKLPPRWPVPALRRSSCTRQKHCMAISA